MYTEGESNRPRGRPKRSGPALISPGEFLVMDLLWLRGPMTGGEICAEMKASRELAYTTVMTVLDKLQLKGFIRTESPARASRYLPMINRKEALDQCLDGFLRDYFNGSLPEFLGFLPTFLAGRGEATQLQSFPVSSQLAPSADPSPSDEEHQGDNLEIELL